MLLTLLHLLRARYRPDVRVTGLEILLDLASVYPPEVASVLTGIPVARLLALAETIGTVPHVTFHMSVGVNQGPFGTLCYVALQALAYLAGQFDRTGGLLFHPLALALAALARQSGMDGQQTPSRSERFPRVLGSVPAGLLAEEILAPGAERVRALIVVAGDPLTSIPGEATLRQALRQLDCLVCVDMFQNATGREADLLLPATSWLERWDLANTSGPLQQAPLLQYAAPVQAPPGEVRSEGQILAELSQQLGRPLFGQRWLAQGWQRLNGPSGVRRSARLLAWGMRCLGQAPWGFPVPCPRPGRYLGRGPRTPGQRVRFWHPELDGEAVRLTASAAVLSHVSAGSGMTCLLICRRRRLGHNSWLHGATRDGQPDGAAWFAPADLLRLEIPRGGEVLLRTVEARCLFHKYLASSHVGATLVVARFWAGTRPAPTGEGLTKWTSSLAIAAIPVVGIAPIGANLRLFFNAISNHAASSLRRNGREMRPSSQARTSVS